MVETRHADRDLTVIPKNIRNYPNALISLKKYVRRHARSILTRKQFADYPFCSNPRIRKRLVFSNTAKVIGGITEETQSFNNKSHILSPLNRRETIALEKKAPLGHGP